VYNFEFGTGATRRSYTYRKSYGVLKKLKGMELRAGGVDKEDGQLLAKWVGNNSWKMKNGSLSIARPSESLQELNETRDEQFEKWEIMVCLTTFSIIESQFRRSKG
jgi:hypothetical protein